MAFPEIGTEGGFFASHSRAAQVGEAVRALVGAIGPCEVRVTKSQVALGTARPSSASGSPAGGPAIREPRSSCR